MPDPRFYKTGPALTGGEIFARAKETDAEAELRGQSDLIVERAAAPGDGDLQCAVVFCEKKSVANVLSDRQFGLCIASSSCADALAQGAPVLVSSAPKYAFADIAARLHSPLPLDEGPAPKIGEGAHIHETAVIGAGAEIGADVVIGPYSVVGPGVVIGDGARISDHVSIGFCIIGARSRILSGARLGVDGFGVAAGPAGLLRLPHLGRVVIGDDVEIGANCAIDRGALNDTRIADSVMIDNLVHIGHNVAIGRGTMIAAQSGFAGSCVVGEGVLFGGQVGLADHITIGDGARIAAQSGVIRDVPAGESWGGTPAMPGRTWLRVASEAARRERNKKMEKK